MRNDKFWDECTTGSLREKIAQFIDNSSLLSKLEGEQYYKLEDALVELFEQNKEMIYREVEKEYRREDVVNHFVNTLGYTEELAAKIPFKVIDSIVTDWNDLLQDNCSYFDAEWESLGDAIQEFYSYIDLSVEEDDSKPIYVAYLSDWFSSHDDNSEQPVCIDEFYDCEMQDEECAEYYLSLTAKLFESEEK